MLGVISSDESEISKLVPSRGIRDGEVGATDFGGHQW